MKKFLKMFFALLCCFGMNTAAMAADYTSQSYLDKVTSIGNGLLQKNSIPVQISFNVMQSDDINAFASTEKDIYVLTGLLNNVSNDDELASVISHEIGHVINSHTTKKSSINMAANTAMANVKMNKWTQFGVQAGQQVVMTKLSRTDEYEADLTGVDLLYNAGYNPLAMISFLYKFSENYVDILSTHPSGDKRTMYVYDYILYNYPEVIEKGFDTISYKNFKLYADGEVSARNANPEALAAFKSEQADLRAKRMEKLEKYKTASQNSGWDTTHSVMQGAGSIYNSIMTGR